PQLTTIPPNPSLSILSMRPFTASLISRTLKTSPKASFISKVSRITTAKMTTSNLTIENTNLNTAPGVELSATQKTLVGSVLDLFAGRPSLEKLQLWSDEGVFEDPITIARGRKQYEAQWYGLQSAFSSIERLSHSIMSSENPISIDMKTKYTVKGINKEQTIESIVNIFTSEDGQKIVKVEDKWNGELPDSSIKDAFRKINAVTVPKMISVPKSKEEDAKRGNA
ncbi:uncharacterized protein BDZ99DRAFT_383627, partial [Mytilinidion resinicola]